MAITDEQRVTTEDQQCPDCGATIPASPAAPRSRPRVPVVPLTAAVVLVAIIAGVAIILVSGSSSDQSGAYRQKLRAAFAPLVSANRSLSSTLQALHGSNVQAAVAATARLQQTLLSSRTAVDVLSAPHASKQLSRESQRALAQENAYVQSVSSVLASPRTSKLSGVSAAASATIAAFRPLTSVAPGAAASIYGSDSLVRWAQGQPRASKGAGAAIPNLPQIAGPTSHGSVVQPAGAAVAKPGTGASDYLTPSGNPVPGMWSLYVAPYASGVGTPYTWSGGQQCDQNIFAGDGTACDFADNIFMVVAAAWHYSGLIPASIITYDPSTDTQYTLTCTGYYGSDSQTDVQCINGYGAGAAFPLWAAKAYY